MKTDRASFHPAAHARRRIPAWSAVFQFLHTQGECLFGLLDSETARGPCLLLEDC